MNMGRRHLLRSLFAGAAITATESLIPFNRVWFFPKHIRIANISEIEQLPHYAGTLTGKQITLATLKILHEELSFEKIPPTRNIKIGSLITVRTPLHWLCPPTGVSE